MRMKTDLSQFDNSDFRPGPLPSRAIWYLVNLCFIRNRFFPFSAFKRALLRLFGAKIGRSVVIKPGVNIKYPWKLSIGDYSWIGEGVWIDNLDHVEIGAHCCISQGALILSGNHDYSKVGFDLLVKPIVLHDGVWIGAKSIVTQGVTCEEHSVLAVNSVASHNLKAFTIYRGNPAEAIKERIIRS